MTLRRHALLATVALLAGCAITSPVRVNRRVPHGSVIAVVTFGDCDIAKEADCAGAGSNAAAIFARVISQKSGLQAIPLPRPVASEAPLSDDAAVAYAKAKGYRYVINGEVRDYSSTGTPPFRANRVAVSLRVLGTSNGKELAIFSKQEHSIMHFKAPDEMLMGMAKQLAAAIILEKKGERPGKFLLYKGNDTD